MAQWLSMSIGRKGEIHLMVGTIMRSNLAVPYGSVEVEVPEHERAPGHAASDRIASETTRAAA